MEKCLQGKKNEGNVSEYLMQRFVLSHDCDEVKLLFKCFVMIFKLVCFSLLTLRSSAAS